MTRQTVWTSVQVWLPGSSTLSFKNNLELSWRPSPNISTTAQPELYQTPQWVSQRFCFNRRQCSWIAVSMLAPPKLVFILGVTGNYETSIPHIHCNWPSFSLGNSWSFSFWLNTDWRSSEHFQANCVHVSLLRPEQGSQPTAVFPGEEGPESRIYCLLRFSSRISAPLLLLMLLISDLMESSAAFTSAATDLSQLFRRLHNKLGKV